MSKLTYDSNNFYIDGEKLQIISGAIHYFRHHPDCWEDRLKKLKACGFNTVETYMCWNLHERREGTFDWSGILDIRRFIKTAQDLGLYCIVRPGPFICAEFDFGGLPSWLMKYKDIKLRCNNELYLSKVENYFKEAIEQIRPFFAENGGNIIAVQVENEYGSYGDDKDYMYAVYNMLLKLDVTPLLFTSDGSNAKALSAGSIKECLAVVNFSSRPKLHFENLRKLRPDQPLMCGEFWSGWFDHWYEKHHVRCDEETLGDYQYMLDVGASVNVYMFCGGTNFGFTPGAGHRIQYTPIITSYDYNAILTEAGDMTDRYYKLKEMNEKHFGVKSDLVVENSVKKAYGKVKLTESAKLFDNLDNLSTPVHSTTPLTMEELGIDFGYVLYRSTISGPIEDSNLVIDGVHDRASVYFDKKFQGIIERPDKKDEIKIALDINESTEISVLCENLGRVNYGPWIGEYKGLQKPPRVDFRFHYYWDMYPLFFDNLDKLSFKDYESFDTPTFYKGILNVDEAHDTFLKLDGFTKGFVVINGFNIGRYWNTAGPQTTLYVPAPLLKPGENEIIVFESDYSNSQYIEFVDTPELGETILKTSYN